MAERQTDLLRIIASHQFPSPLAITIPSTSRGLNCVSLSDTAKKPNENRQRSSLAEGQRRREGGRERGGRREGGREGGKPRLKLTKWLVAWMRLSAKSAVWARTPRSSGVRFTRTHFGLKDCLSSDLKFHFDFMACVNHTFLDSFPM